MTTIIESLGITLGADITDFQKKFQQAQTDAQELTRKLNDTGRVITEVGAKMAASSALAVAGIAAMNGGFDGHVKTLAKVAGSIQGLTIVTGNMMQGFAKAKESLATFNEIQNRIVRDSNHSKNSLLALGSAAGTVGSTLAAAATIGWTIGTALDRLLGISEQFNHMEEVAPTPEDLARLERLGKVADETYLKLARTKDQAIKMLVEYKRFTEEEARKVADAHFAVFDRLVGALVSTGKYSQEQARQTVNAWGDAAADMVRTVVSAHQQIVNHTAGTRTIFQYAASVNLSDFEKVIAIYDRQQRLIREGESNLTDWLAIEWENRTMTMAVEMLRWEESFAKSREAAGMTEEQFSARVRREYQEREQALTDALKAEYLARRDAIEKHAKLVEDETEFVRGALSKQIAAYREAAQQRVQQMRDAYAEIARLEENLAALADRRRDTGDRLDDARFGVQKRGMSEEDAYLAERERAYQMLDKAAKAQAAGQHELARQYTDKAMAMFQGLVREIKDAEGNILVSLQQSIRDAEAGLNAVEATYRDIAAAEEESLKAQIKRQKEMIDELRGELEALFTDMNRTITITLETTEAKAALAELKAQLDEFIAQMRGEAAAAGNQNPEKHAYGGWVGGTRVGDSTPAMLTPGEFVVNADAARTYAPALEALNGMRSPVATGGGTTTVNIHVSEALTREYIRDVLAPEINRSISRQRIRRFN